ncbi:hypothetical protein B0H13DRAFT_1866462 [Mycena leptocephala]|nr:hypothetical protein B0H13DRAFT_1866462 [Mycena leptocephala]
MASADTGRATAQEYTRFFRRQHEHGEPVLSEAFPFYQRLPVPARPLSRNRHEHEEEQTLQPKEQKRWCLILQEYELDEECRRYLLTRWIRRSVGIRARKRWRWASTNVDEGEEEREGGIEIREVMTVKTGAASLSAPHASRAQRTCPRHRALVQAMPAVALEDRAERTSTSSIHARARVCPSSTSGRRDEAQHLRTLEPKPSIAIPSSGAPLPPTTRDIRVPSTTRTREKKSLSQYIIYFEKQTYLRPMAHRAIRKYGGIAWQLLWHLPGPDHGIGWLGDVKLNAAVQEQVAFKFAFRSLPAASRRVNRKLTFKQPQWLPHAAFLRPKTANTCYMPQGLLPNSYPGPGPKSNANPGFSGNLRRSWKLAATNHKTWPRTERGTFISLKVTAIVLNARNERVFF